MAVQGALNLNPFLGALSFFGQVNAQNRREREAKRAGRFGLLGGVAGATAAGIGTGGNPAAISAGFAGGQQIGRGLGGGRADPGVVLQAGLTGAGALQQQNIQQADDRALGALSQTLTQQQNPALAGGADDFGVGAGPEAAQSQRATDIQGILSASRGPGALQRAGALMALQRASQGPQPSEFTLAPGAARFRGTTRIAEQPKETESKLPDPRTVTLRKGNNTITLAREDPKFRERLLNLTNDGYTTITQRQDLSAAERKQAAEIEAGVGALDELDKLFNPDFVGPIDGRLLQGKAATGIGLTDKEANFIAANAAVENEMIKLFSGAAVSGNEEVRMARQIPQLTDPPTLWRAKMKQTRKNKARLLKIIRRKQGGSAATVAAPSSSVASATISKMSVSDLLTFLDKPDLTRQQKLDALARMKALNAQLDAK